MISYKAITSIFNYDELNIRRVSSINSFIRFEFSNPNGLGKLNIFFFIIYYKEHQPSTILREDKRWEVIYVVEKASVTTKTNEDLPELII